MMDETIDAILTLFYLMIFYEAQFGNNNATTSIHLQGLVSFFRSSKQLSGTNGDRLSIDRLPPLSQHLLLLTLACNLEILPERPDAKDSFKYFLGGESPGMFYDQLFQAAHHTLPRVWDTRYPAEQLLDDLENLRALDLIHECSKLRFKVENLDQSSQDLPLNISHMTGIREDLRRTREKFDDLLRIAKLAQVPGNVLRRVFAVDYQRMIATSRL
ncbi:hypothetical protein N7504_010998 [Penicillium tannophilum]|nr:hypothetical protein N7504_010998 [Penicillium tannophilum]